MTIMPSHDHTGKLILCDKLLVKYCKALTICARIKIQRFDQERHLFDLRPPLTIALLAFGSAAWAQQQCPVAPLQAVDYREKGSGVQVKANQTEVIRDQLASFSGNVEILSDTSLITAERAKINKQQQSLSASGNISYQDKDIAVNSDDIRLNFTSGELQLDKTEYRMLTFTGRGQAGQISLTRNEGIALTDVSFTTCPLGQEDWEMKASEITLEPGEIWGEAWHTRFYLMDIPVFYLPYFTFPVTDKRQSGLLSPEFNSNDSVGFSYAQPIYWNIADNYDATLTPRLMARRGIQLQTEFRYLSERHGGQIDLEYMPEDSEFENDDTRYFYRWQHTSRLTPQWRVDVDLNGLSDDNYIVDLDSDFYNRADTHLNRNLMARYTNNDFTFSAAIRDFQTIGSHPDTYRALPEFKLGYLRPLGGGFEFDINSELAYFDNPSDQAPQASRLHIAPAVGWRSWAPWGELSAKATLLQTYYHQKDGEQFGLKENVNRTLGRFRLYGALNLERESDLFGTGGLQTLEPRFQYLYTTYKDQSMIGLYDTARLLTDYIGLFRGQAFTGPDRILDTNQITAGLTSRWLDANNREQLRLSVAQIFYFQDNLVAEQISQNSRSELAAEVNWRFSPRWAITTGTQFDPDDNKVSKSNLTLEYRESDEKLVQLSHRYVRELSGEKIDQIGLTASWPITGNWYLVGRWFKDAERHRTIESYAGIQYESCCWALQFVAERYLNNRVDALGQRNTNEFESGISLKFVFKGMGQSKSRRALLDDGLFGYRQPYFLNN